METTVGDLVIVNSAVVINSIGKNLPVWSLRYFGEKKPRSNVFVSCEIYTFSFLRNLSTDKDSG